MIAYDEIKRIRNILNVLTVSNCVHISKNDFDMYNDEYLEFIVKSVINIFEMNFDIMINSDVIIVNRRGVDSSPESLREQGIINLYIDGNHPCQFIYQLAHEMCHYYYFYIFNIPKKYKWFEETICELVSELTLNILSKSWSGPKLFAYVSNAQASKNYLQNIIRTNEIRIKRQHMDYFAIEDYLENNCYDRDINAFFALKVFNMIKGTSLKSFFNELRLFIHNLIHDTDSGFAGHIQTSTNRLKKVFENVFIQNSFLYRTG